MSGSSRSTDSQPAIASSSAALGPAVDFASAGSGEGMGFKDMAGIRGKCG
jgi:hypothetical protein